MNLCYVTLLFVAVSGLCHAQTTSSRDHITGNIEADLNALIPSGEIMMDVMDNVSVPPRRQQLVSKLSEAMRKNPDLAYRQGKQDSAQRTAFMAEIGFTEADMKYFEGTSDVTATSSGQVQVRVQKSDGKITFAASGKLSVLNGLVIDTKKNVATVGNYTLAFRKAVTVGDANNVFKTAWRGYTWQFLFPQGEWNFNSAEDLRNAETKFYSLTIGQFDSTGQTYLQISGSEQDHGTTLVSYEIPMVFATGGN